MKLSALSHSNVKSLVRSRCVAFNLESLLLSALVGSELPSVRFPVFSLDLWSRTAILRLVPEVFVLLCKDSWSVHTCTHIVKRESSKPGREAADSLVDHPSVRTYISICLNSLWTPNRYDCQSGRAIVGYQAVSRSGPDSKCRGISRSELESKPRNGGMPETKYYPTRRSRLTPTNRFIMNCNSPATGSFNIQLACTA